MTTQFLKRVTLTLNRAAILEFWGQSRPFRILRGKADTIRVIVGVTWVMDLRSGAFDSMISAFAELCTMTDEGEFQSLDANVVFILDQQELIVSYQTWTDTGGPVAAGHVVGRPIYIRYGSEPLVLEGGGRNAKMRVILDYLDVLVA